MAPTTIRGHTVLPFRIPFFRIFYSTTYTILYIITLCLLAITPTSIIFTAVDSEAYQYVFMVGGTYLLIAILAIFIYTSRLYTNRSTLAGVGKPYIPIEKGELGRKVRKMIVAQFERSAMVTWEAKPRDIKEEILAAEGAGSLRPVDKVYGGSDGYIVGRILEVDPSDPPWGRIAHAGWLGPSWEEGDKHAAIQCADVIAELPHIIEARAVSLCPPDILPTAEGEETVADPAVLDLLRRPATMGLREYLTQISYLGLSPSPETAQNFLNRYERVRFCGQPVTEREFKELMLVFSELLSGMNELRPEIVAEIRAQMENRADEAETQEAGSIVPLNTAGDSHNGDETPSTSSSRSPRSSILSPITAKEAQSRDATPFLQQRPQESEETLGSVIRRSPALDVESENTEDSASERLGKPGRSEARSVVSLPSDAGSVVWHEGYDEGSEHVVQDAG
ncbi:hypothetical protein KC332_g3127 [Hortaea werneckii]|uniref:Defect at low temperature protein 1 n=1 Tax=Hortaea werneckii TaxID=91943 RepID=A0A3M7IWQ3_HORWE|nr:hypothetical protein KC350_g10531 [Hortaea werneckii]KAI6840290.1 hypothetical protein KC342_g2985 [Hortaea werneckii]KAI6846678.1 hypothetical protein KC358_g2729 [Hortaea werneckii]KAI6918801.1 hypothetical protein KC348_g10807 [Hortaea werneckii]KAI6941941.1 hypothetical protein KC341_g2561 [Hortaea werneckii]